MKRIFTVLMAVVVSTAMMVADEIVKIDGLYYSLGTTTATLVKDQSSDKSVYKEYTSVTIPSTVTSISNSAFQNNPLTSVVWKPKTCSIGTETYAPFYSTNS